MAEKHKTKSELLREADRLFSQFIRNRDADKNGNIACVCCGKIYNLEQVDKEGKKLRKSSERRRKWGLRGLFPANTTQKSHLAQRKVLFLS